MRQRVHNVARWFAGISLFFASIFSYVGGTLFDEDSFAELLGQALEEPSVRTGLATRAVDIAFDSLNADSALAEALPESLSLAATPALELAKPSVGAAGAELLAVESVQTGFENAARSVHRQTVTAALDTEERDVTINVRPVLVVTADAIVGPAGARAAVGVELPDSATSFSLGSNQGPAWSVLRALALSAAAAFLLFAVAVVVYFAAALKGTRLLAARQLGRTFITAGIVVLLTGALLGLLVGIALEAALGTGSGLALGKFTFGGQSDQFGGLTLGALLLDPVVASGRRSIVNGVILICASYLFGSGAVAQGFRTGVRSRSHIPLVESINAELPHRLRSVRFWISAGLVIVLIGWTTRSLRAVLTLAGISLVLHLALTVRFTDSSRWSPARQLLGWKRITATDATERTALAAGRRKGLWFFTVLLMLVWPSYTASSATLLAVLVGSAFAFTYWWETKPTRIEDRRLELLEEPTEAGWSTRRKLTAGAIAAAVLLILLAPGDSGRLNPAEATGMTRTGPTACNGHPELCGRPFDQVVLAGSHNSMSASELGWELANHRRAIPAQLEGGIRALLIDVQKWEVDVNLSELEFDSEAASIAEAALLGAEPPEDGLWMCHKLCQLGGTPFRDFLGDLRAFLETNPNEVVAVMIQDDAEKSAIKNAVEEAGLLRFALEHEPGAAWPTLGEMIEADTRVVFMAENDGDPTGWYQAVYEGNVEETGFRYDVLEDFDCAPNRGVEGSALLLINHWVETGVPVPDQADQVNSRAVLMQRVEECQAVRGRAPSVIAVNFWERGDLLAVVDELNGLGS